LGVVAGGRAKVAVPPDTAPLGDADALLLGVVEFDLDEPQAASATAPTAAAAPTRSQARPGRSFLIETWSSR
jgi:hypothetical protein